MSADEFKAAGRQGLDIGGAVRFVFDDEQWVGKIGIGAVMSLLAFLLIPIPLLIGWGVGVVRNVMNMEPRPLPAWEDWGKLFSDGIKVIVAQFVYTLPFLLLLCVGSLGTGMLGAATEQSSDVLATLGGATIFLMSCLGLLFAVALLFISPAIIVQYVRSNDDLGACFRFGEVLGIARENIGNILIIVLVSMAVGLVLSVVTGVLALIPCLGWIAVFIVSAAAGPYTTALVNHLYGQIAQMTPGKADFVG